MSAPTIREAVLRLRPEFADAEKLLIALSPETYKNTYFATIFGDCNYQQVFNLFSAFFPEYRKEHPINPFADAETKYNAFMKKYARGTTHAVMRDFTTRDLGVVILKLEAIRDTNSIIPHNTADCHIKLSSQLIQDMCMYANSSKQTCDYSDKFQLTRDTILIMHNKEGGSTNHQIIAKNCISYLQIPVQTIVFNHQYYFSNVPVYLRPFVAKLPCGLNVLCVNNKTFVFDPKNPNTIIGVERQQIYYEGRPNSYETLYWRNFVSPHSTEMTNLESEKKILINDFGFITGYPCISTNVYNVSELTCNYMECSLLPA